MDNPSLWGVDIKFKKIEGITFGPRITEECLEKIKNFTFSDQDVLCATYPKTGTLFILIKYEYNFFTKMGHNFAQRNYPIFILKPTLESSGVHDIVGGWGDH